jgi:acetolactate synthase-1/2/3 large subunit
MADPRGPVWLDVDAEVARASALPVAASCRRGALSPPDPAVRDQAAPRLAAAARPVLVVGVQCRPDGSAQWVRALAEARPAPVLVTPAAKGVVPDPHPLCLGLFTGDVAGHPLLARADLVVAVGVEAIEVAAPAWPLRAPVLHVARSPHTGAVWRPEVEVVGEIATILEELAPRLRGRAAADWDVAELDRLRRESRAALAAPPARAGVAPSARAVIAVARAVSPPGTVAVVDGALASVAAAGWDAVGPGELLAGAADAPFALPAAVAAALARPGRRIVAFSSAGALARTAAELAAVARLRLPITAVAIDAGGAHGARALACVREAGLAAAVATSVDDAGRALASAQAAGSPGALVVGVAPDPLAAAVPDRVV